MNKRTCQKALLCGIPVFCCANVGTPLMWASMIYLLVGNALIGLLEGRLIAKYFDLPKGKAISTCILANYFSAWVGGIGLTYVAAQLPLNLYSGRWFVWLSIPVFLLLSIVLEWPFIMGLFRNRSRYCQKLWMSEKRAYPSKKQKTTPGSSREEGYAHEDTYYETG